MRQEGVSSKVQQALEWEEFFVAVAVHHLYTIVNLWYYLTSVLCLQWPIMGCIYDVMKLG